MQVFKKIYIALFIGLDLYAVGYIFGEWLATGQIDLLNLNMVSPMALGLPALLLSTKENVKN
ncbi:hypothetical protein [Streptococcus sp. 11273D007BW]|nr:hypothetical protein [Streptococcus sp.]